MSKVSFLTVSVLFQPTRLRYWLRKTKWGKRKKKWLKRSRERSEGEAGRKQGVYPILLHIPVYRLLSKLGSLLREWVRKKTGLWWECLTKLVRDCSVLGYYILYTRPPSLAGHAVPSQAKRGPRHCVPRKHPDDSEKKERSDERKGWCGLDLEWFGDGKKEEGFESKSSEWLWISNKSENKGWISIARGNKASRLFTIPRSKFKSSAKDLSPGRLSLWSVPKFV